MHISRHFVLTLGLGALLGVGVTLLGMRQGNTGDHPASMAAIEANRIPSTPIAPPAPPPVAQPELDRITRQNAELAAELADARRLLAESDTELARTRENLEELRRPLAHDTLSSTVSARLRSGEAVVTGGYQLPDGTRLYAFVQPELIDVDGVSQVRLQGRFNLLDDETGANVGLDSIATNAANTLQHGEVWIRDEVDTVLADLARRPGALSITLPEITVRPGGTATLQLEDPPLTLKVTPSPTGTGDDMDLEVRLEQTPPESPPPPPVLQQTPPPSPQSVEG